MHEIFITGPYFSKLQAYQFKIVPPTLSGLGPVPTPMQLWFVGLGPKYYHGIKRLFAFMKILRVPIVAVKCAATSVLTAFTWKTGSVVKMLNNLYMN